MKKLKGHRQIIDAMDYGLKPKYIFASDEAFQTSIGNDLYLHIQNLSSGSFYQVTENIIKSLSNTVQSQGVIAIFDKPLKIKSLFFEDEKSIILILDSLADPGNLGTLIRTAYGFNVSAIILVNGCEVWSPKVTRSSMGMNLRIPIIETCWDNIRDILCNYHEQYCHFNKKLNMSNNKSFCIYTCDKTSTAIPYYNINYNLYHSSLILIGSESIGLSNQAKAFLSNNTSLFSMNTIQIPIHKQLNSLNAAIAGGIVMSEITRQIV